MSQTPQNNAVQAAQQEVHPLCKIQIPQSLAPFAQPFADSLATFRQCFPTNKEADMTYLQQVEYAMQAMQANSYLVTCAQKNPVDLLNALKQIALSHLSLSPVFKQGYLVPFSGKITFMPSYIGLRDLLIRTGLVVNIEAHLVYPEDVFNVEFGANASLVHKPNFFSGKRSPKDVIGGYFVAKLTSGEQVFDVMTIAEIEKVHKASPSYGKTSPWDSWPEEMMKKTLIRRGFKAVPHTNATEANLKIIEMAFNNDNQFFFDPEAERKAASQSHASIFDVPVEEVEQPEQQSSVAQEPAQAAQ